jgi:hypothetical protein
MDSIAGSTIAALTGSAIGGLTPILSNYLVQRGLTERETLNRELAARQTLYSSFIEYATKLYVTASTRQFDNADELVGLYALISRIRLVASESVIDAAEKFAINVTKRYGEAAISIEDLKNETISPHIDPLREFSRRCREELGTILQHKNR